MELGGVITIATEQFLIFAAIGQSDNSEGAVYTNNLPPRFPRPSARDPARHCPMKALRPILFSLLRRSSVHLALAGSITALLSLPSTHAASATWNLNPTNGNWIPGSSDINWSSGAGAFPGSATLLNSTDVATFGSSSVTTINLNSASLDILGITFGGSSSGTSATAPLSAFTIGSTSGNSLFLTGGGSIALVADTSSTGITESVDAPLVLEGNYTFSNSNADATNVLNIAGGISNGTSNAITLTLGGTNLGNNVVSGAITDGTLGGTTGLTKTGAGTWTLSGNNTFSGPISVGVGTLILNGDNSGMSGNITLGNGSTLDIGSATALGTGSVTLPNNSKFDNSSGHPLTLTTNNALNWGVTTGGASSNFLGSNDLNLGTGPVTLLAPAGQKFTLVTNNIGVRLTVGGVVSGVANFTKSGVGTLIFTGANTFTGTTTFANGTSGIINYQNGIAFGTNSAITVASGNTVQVQGGIAGGNLLLTLAGAGASNATGALENVGGNNSYAGAIAASTATISSDSGTLTLTGGISNGGTTLTFTGSGNVTVSTNGISGTGGLAKNGTGMLTLSGDSSYTGLTSINLGTLALNNGTIPANSSVNNTISVGSATVTSTAGNATLLIVGNSTIGAPLSIRGGDGIASGQGTLSLADGAINTLTLSTTGLTMGNATSGTSSVLDMEVGATADSIVIAVDRLRVNGNVTLNITGLGGLTGAEQTLISANIGSGAAFAITNFTLNTSGNFGGYVVSLSSDSATIGKHLFLDEVANAAPTTAYWKGTNGDAVWSSFTGGNANISNFTTDAGGTSNANGALAGTTNVIFNATGATNSANTTLGADTTINSLTFTGAATSSVGIGGNNTLTINASNANGNTAGNGITVASGSGNHTLSTKVALGADQTWTVTDATSTLTASNQVSGAFALTKGGAGTLVLSGSSNYTGATNVNSGKVIVSGALNGTTAVHVASGATLASGALGGSITTGATSGTAIDIAGILSPGDANIAPITLTLAIGTKLNFESGSTLRLDLASNGSSDSVIFGGSASDWLSGSGNVTLALNGTINYSSTYVIFQNVSTPGFSFAGITGYDTSNWKATVVQSGNNYDLSFAAVPEPGSLASLVGGLGLLVGLRRRHRRRA